MTTLASWWVISLASRRFHIEPSTCVRPLHPLREAEIRPLSFHTKLRAEAALIEKPALECELGDHRVTPHSPLSAPTVYLRAQVNGLRSECQGHE